MDAFHYTHRGNLASILDKGLLINSPYPGLVRRPRYHQRLGCRPIFLTDSPACVRERMIDEERVHEYVLLIIKTPLILLPERDFYYTSPYLDLMSSTYVCFDHIPPEAISLCK